MARLVLASREVWPFVEGGGVGRFIWTAAGMLSPHHEVTILTAASHRDAYERMRAAGDPRLPAGAEFAFAGEPEGDTRPMTSYGQAWSVALLESLRELEPDLVEFADYLGEGFATVHARRSGDPALARTRVAVRAHATAEIVLALDERPADPANGPVWALERFALRHADALLWPGGDVLERYEAFYGDVAPGIRSPLPVAVEALEEARPAPEPDGGPVRLLYLGRLQRVKGVLELAEAVAAAPDADLRLTMVGGDTDSAPGGGSMLDHLRETIGADPRVEVRGRVPHDEVAGLIADHHAVVVPTRWETFSYVTREALAGNRPVLATRVGSIPEVVVPGRSGWTAASSRFTDLRTAITAAGREEAERLIADRGPRGALEDSLPTAEQLASHYEQLAKPIERRAAPHPAPRIGAVVAVVPGDAGLEGTVADLRGQRAAAIAVGVAGEAAALPPVGRMADVLRSTVVAGAGRAAAWLAGAAAAREDLVLLVPAGARIDPGFAARAAAVLAADDRFDYVTAFARGSLRPWAAPLGGESLAAAGSDAGATVAVVRRPALLAVAPATTERALWSQLRGIVIQEPLVTRLPRRPADEEPPAHGGAPDPASVDAAFGGLLPSASAA